MKTILLTLVFVALIQNIFAEEIRWEGIYQTISSSEGHSSFNTRKSKIFCKITHIEGKLTGTTTAFGVDAKPDSPHTDKITGTLHRDRIEWRGECQLKAGKYSHYTTKNCLVPKLWCRP